MNFSPYTKPFNSPYQLVVHMQNKGLQIQDPAQAEALLAQINYYRFKIYLGACRTKPVEAKKSLV